MSWFVLICYAPASVVQEHKFRAGAVVEAKSYFFL